MMVHSPTRNRRGEVAETRILKLMQFIFYRLLFIVFRSRGRDIFVAQFSVCPGLMVSRALLQTQRLLKQQNKK
jgi:hypothetical protein